MCPPLHYDPEMEKSGIFSEKPRKLNVEHHTGLFGSIWGYYYEKNQKM